MPSSAPPSSTYGDSGSLNMMGLLKMHQRQIFGTNTADVPAVPITASDYLNEVIPKPMPRDPLHFRPSTTATTTTTSNRLRPFADITSQSASQRNVYNSSVNNDNTVTNTLRDSWCDPARLLPSSIAMGPDLLGGGGSSMRVYGDVVAGKEESPEELAHRLEEERNAYLPTNHPLRYSGHLPHTTTPPSTPSLPSHADNGIQHPKRRSSIRLKSPDRNKFPNKEDVVEEDGRWASSRPVAHQKISHDDGVPFHLKVQELESRFRDQMEVHRGLDNAMTQIDLVTKQERARRAAERTAEMSAKVAQEIKERQELQRKMAVSRQAHLANHVEHQEAATLRHMYGGGQIRATATGRPGTAPVASTTKPTTTKTTTSSTSTTTKPSTAVKTTKKSSKDAGSSPAPAAPLHPAVSATQGGISVDSGPYRRVRLVAVPDDTLPMSSPSVTNKSGTSSPASPNTVGEGGGGGLSRPPHQDTDMVAQSIDTAITSSMLSSSFQASVVGDEEVVRRGARGVGGLSKPPAGKSKSKKSSHSNNIKVKFEKGTRYGSSSDSDTSSDSIRSMSYTDSIIYSEGGSYFTSNSSSRVTSDDNSIDDDGYDGVYDGIPRGGGRGRQMVVAGGGGGRGGKVSVREVMEMLGGLVAELNSKQSAHEERVKNTLQRLQVHTREKQEDQERRLLEQLKAVSKELEGSSTPTAISTEPADGEEQPKDGNPMPPAVNFESASITTPTAAPAAVVNPEPKPSGFPFTNSLGPRPSLPSASQSAAAAAAPLTATTHPIESSTASRNAVDYIKNNNAEDINVATNQDREAALETARRLIAKSMAHEEEKRVQEHLAALLKARTEQRAMAEKEAQRQEMIGRDPVLQRINDDIGTLKAFMGRLQDHMVVVTERKRMEAVRRGLIAHSQKLVAQRDAILRGEFAPVHHGALPSVSRRGRGGGLSSRGRGGSIHSARGGGGLSSRDRGGGLSTRPNQRGTTNDDDDIEDEVDDGFSGGRGPSGLSRPPPRATNTTRNFGDDVISNDDEIGYEDDEFDDGFEDFVLGTKRDNMGVYTDDDIIDEVDDDGGDDEYYYGGGTATARHNNNGNAIYEDSIEEYDDGLVVDEFDTPARKKNRPAHYDDDDDIIDDISDPQSDGDDGDDFYIPRGAAGTNNKTILAKNAAVNDSIQEEIVKEEDSVEYGEDSFENSSGRSSTSSSLRNTRKQDGAASAAGAEADALFFRPAEIKLIAKLITAGGSGRRQGKTAKRVGMSTAQLSKKEEDLVVRLLRQSEAEQAAIDAEGPGAEFERQRQHMKEALTRAQIKTANHKKKKRGRDSNTSSSDWSSSSTSSTGKASSLFFRQELEDTSSSHASDTSSVLRHRARRQNLKRTCLSHLYLQRERHDKRYNRKESKHLLIESPSPARDAARKRRLSSSHLSRTPSSSSSLLSGGGKVRERSPTTSSRSSSSSAGSTTPSRGDVVVGSTAAEVAAQRRREAFLKRGAAANLKSPSIDSVEDVESIGSSSSPPTPPRRSPRRASDSSSQSSYSTGPSRSSSGSSSPRRKRNTTASSSSRRPSSSFARTTDTTRHSAPPSTVATLSTDYQQYARVKSPVSNLIQYRADGTIDFMNTEIPSTNERRRQKRREKHLLREQGIMDDEGRGGGNRRLFEPRGHFADVEENSSSTTPQRRRAKIVLSSAEHTPSSRSHDDLGDDEQKQLENNTSNVGALSLLPKNVADHHRTDNSDADGDEDGDGRSALRDAIVLHKRARKAKNATEAMAIIEEQERRAHARLVKQRQIVAKHEVKFQMFDRNNNKSNVLEGEEEMASDDSEAWARIQRERIKREISSSSRRRIVDDNDDRNVSGKKSMSSPKPFSYFYGDRPWKNEIAGGQGNLLLAPPHDDHDDTGNDHHDDNSRTDDGNSSDTPRRDTRREVPALPSSSTVLATDILKRSKSPEPKKYAVSSPRYNSLPVSSHRNTLNNSSSASSTSPDGSLSSDHHSAPTNITSSSSTSNVSGCSNSDGLNQARTTYHAKSPLDDHHTIINTDGDGDDAKRCDDDNHHGHHEDDEQEASHYSSSICSVLDHLVPPLPPALPEEDWRQARTRQPSPDKNHDGGEGDDDDCSSSNSSNSPTHISVQTVPLTEAQRQRKLAEERRELAVELATMDTWKERQKRRFSSVYSTKEGRRGSSAVAVQDDEVPPPPPPLEGEDEHVSHTSQPPSTNPWAGFEAMLFSRFGPTAADEEALHGAAAIRRAREKLEAMRSAGIDISNSEGDAAEGGDSGAKKMTSSSKSPSHEDVGSAASTDDDDYPSDKEEAGMMDYSNTSEDASNDDYYDRVLRHKQHPTLSTRKEDLLHRQQQEEAAAEAEMAAARQHHQQYLDKEAAREAVQSTNAPTPSESGEEEASASSIDADNAEEEEYEEDNHTTTTSTVSNHNDDDGYESDFVEEEDEYEDSDAF